MLKLTLICCLLALALAADNAKANKTDTTNKAKSTNGNDDKSLQRKQARAKLADIKLNVKRMDAIEKQLKELTELTKNVKVQDQWKSIVSSLARQVSLQQMYVQEMTRTSGYSGIKVTRLNTRGTRPYHHATFTRGAPGSMHNHNNYKYTVGMGELVAVLNGVQFRTRHNDYKMYMPSTTSTAYGATEPVPYPQVPPEVLKKATLDEQIAEMREWFKAWKNQDYSKRDYRKYFKPVLCYLEGMWTYTDGNKIDEPFASERHSIDASSFFDLQDKIRYTSETGRKSNKENYAFLPTTIAKMDDQGMPVYAQWNYKILCHPLKQDVPLSRFKIEDDLQVRVARSQQLKDAATSRSTRYSLYPNPPKKGKFEDGFVRGSRMSFLDSLMSEIPGKDNYQGKIVDEVFGETAYRPEAKPPPFVNGQRDWSRVEDPLNVAYYHSQYKVMSKDAMGLSNRLRGYSDGHLYVAYNTQKKIPSFKCSTYESRVSYAIPLEIIYLTPLNTWNPYDLPFSDNVKCPKKGPKCTRNGGTTAETAFTAASLRSYYITPSSFFDAKKSGERDKADTVKANAMGVLDKNGTVRLVRASGIPIVTPSIPDVGQMRIRYPIMPLHIDGDHAYKTVEALQDMALYPHKYAALYPQGTFSSVNGSGVLDPIYEFSMALTRKDPPGLHTHTVQLTLSDLKSLRNKQPLTVVTSLNNGHDHELTLHYTEGKRGNIYFGTCDGAANYVCWDGHKSPLNCENCPKSLNELTG